MAEHTTEPDNYLFTHWPDLRWSPRIAVPLRAGDANQPRVLTDVG